MLTNQFTLFIKVFFNNIRKCIAFKTRGLKFYFFEFSRQLLR